METIINTIKNGGLPSLTGVHLNDDDYQKIADAISSKKEELDKYLSIVVASRRIATQ